jgi:putative membrane protein insertion efficiency factor
VNLAQFTLIGAVRIYRGIISPVLTAVFTPLGFGCRFHPTCSQYAADAIRTHGASKGTWLAARRLCRCHPWGGSGYDPVPAAGSPWRGELREPVLSGGPEKQNATNHARPDEVWARRARSSSSELPGSPPQTH